MAQAEQTGSPPPGAQFRTTHWSIVLDAGPQSAQRSEALDRFCRAYWYPLYAYVRRRGFVAQDAEDLTQDFFHHLLASDWVSRADPSKGRFRTFLLCGIQNFLANDGRDRHVQSAG